MYEPKFSYCDLDLEDRNPFFTHDTLAYNDASPLILGLVTNGSAMHKTSSKLTLTKTFNLVCDIELEHRNPTFSLDTSLLMMMYTQIEFGCKKTHWFRTNKRYSRNRHILIIQAHTVTLTLTIESLLFFSQDIPVHGGAPQYHVWLQKVAYKHSAEWEQICVTSVTSITPEDTTVLSLL